MKTLNLVSAPHYLLSHKLRTKLRTNQKGKKTSLGVTQASFFTFLVYYKFKSKKCSSLINYHALLINELTKVKYMKN